MHMVFLWQEKKKKYKNNTDKNNPIRLLNELKHSKRAQEKRTRKEKYFVEPTTWRLSGNEDQLWHLLKITFSLVHSLMMSATTLNLATYYLRFTRIPLSQKTKISF
jgi:hypothetical protein